MASKRLIVALLTIAVFTPAAALRAEPGENPDLYKAYFLEKACRDYTGARELYHKAASDSSQLNRRAAIAGENRCRDELAAQNLATLMPPDALAYVELNRPGEILEKLCDMLGLTTNDMRAILAERPSASDNAPFHVPNHVAISPAIFECLRAFGGAAVGLTGFDHTGGARHSGLLVIHHGDATMLRGLLETAFQFSPTTEKIADMPTFGFECPKMGTITGVLTDGLLIIGTSRDLLQGAVARLTGDAPSLASREDLRDVMTQREGATLFAFADIQGCLKVAKSTMSDRDVHEFNVANAIADLDSFRWASLSFGIHDKALGAQIAVHLADDHHSIAYNLLRLPPMSRKCLDAVPANAAAIFGLGLNPALVNAAVDTARRDGKVAGPTGLDLGREFFGNIQELCGFVIPGDVKASDDGHGPKNIPNGGLILAVNDPARSKALWNQILSLPGLVEGSEPVAPEETKIGDTDATAYTIPHFGKVYMSELDGRIALATSRAALKAMIHAKSRGKSIANDEIMGPVIAKMPADSSIMLAAHFGRLAEIGMNKGGMGMMAGQAKETMSKMIFWAGIGQSPNQLTVRVALGGLPDVNEALKTYGPMLNGFVNMAFKEMQHSHEPKIVKKAAKATGKAARVKKVESSEDDDDSKPQSLD
ncbi:MAG TPA: hypothetical protein VMV81_13745 [Phycisphaerae bacterium]|nr:hypothetical protein [Phycisphaerae bacterium]